MKFEDIKMGLIVQANSSGRYGFILGLVNNGFGDTVPVVEWVVPIDQYELGIRSVYPIHHAAISIVTGDTQ